MTPDPTYDPTYDPTPRQPRHHRPMARWLREVAQADHHGWFVFPGTYAKSALYRYKEQWALILDFDEVPVETDKSYPVVKLAVRRCLPESETT